MGSSGADLRFGKPTDCSRTVVFEAVVFELVVFKLLCLGCCVEN